MLGKTASRETIRKISSTISRWNDTSKTALSTEKDIGFSSITASKNFPQLPNAYEFKVRFPENIRSEKTNYSSRNFATIQNPTFIKEETTQEKNSEQSSNFENLSRDDFKDIALDEGGKKQIGRIAGRYITYTGEDTDKVKNGDTFLGKIPGIANDGVDLRSSIATGGMVIHSIDDHVPNNLLGRAEVAVAHLLKGIFDKDDSGIIIPDTFLVHKETGQKHKKDSNEFRDGYFENGCISEFVASKVVDLKPSPEDLGPGYIYWMQDKLSETNYSPLTDMFATFAAVGGLDSMGPNFTNCGFKKETGEFVAFDFGVALGEGLESSERFSANGYLRTCDKTRGIIKEKADSSNASDVAWGSLDGYFDKFSSAEMAQILYRRYVNVNEFMKSNDIFASADPKMIEETFDKLAQPSPIEFEDQEQQGALDTYNSKVQQVAGSFKSRILSRQKSAQDFKEALEFFYPEENPNRENLLPSCVGIDKKYKELKKEMGTEAMSQMPAEEKIDITRNLLRETGIPKADFNKRLSEQEMQELKEFHKQRWDSIFSEIENDNKNRPR